MWLTFLKFRVADSAIYKYLVAIAFTLLAVGLSRLLWSTVFDAPFLFFFAAVALSAWQGGLVPGMVSAALSIVLADYFLIEPRYQVFTSVSDLIQFAIFSLVSLLIGWLEENRNRSEQSLRELRDELAVVLNGIADGVTAQDMQGNVLFANAAAATLTGYPSPEVMIHTPVTDLQRKYQMFDAESNPLSYDRMPRHQVFRAGENASLTFKMRFVDNFEERWIDLTSAPVFDDRGNVKMAVNIFRDMTQRIETERDLSRFAALVRNSQDAIIGKSLTGVINSWNPGAERLYGYSAQEAIGQPISLIFPEDLKPREMQLIDRLAKGEKIEHYETTRIRKDGQLVDISLTISPIRTATGNLVGYSTIERDITERKRLLQQIELEKRTLATVLDTVPGIVYKGSGDADAETQGMDFISSYAQSMLGYTLEEWNASPNFWQQVTHPDDWDKAVERANETYQLGIPGPVPFRCITKDGRVLHAESYNGVITDAAGQRIGTCGIVLDVTERKQRESEILRLTALIEAQRQRLDAIVSNVPGIIFDTTFDTVEENQVSNFISDYVETMLGYPPQCWKDDPNFWAQIVDPEDLKISLLEAEAAFKDQRAGNVQFRCRHADGETVHAESYFDFVQEGNQVRQYGVIMDITKRKQTEDALKEFTEELRRSNEELEQFAYVASHDLQEPLRMVTSYLQLIESRYADKLDDDAHEFIDFAVDGASRMKTLINDLLAYSRVQRSEVVFETVNMQQVFEQVTHHLQLTIEETNASLTADALPDITANERQMVQLLQNLIGNALKFRGDDAPKIHVGARQIGSRWQFSVQDNGIGIEPDYQDRIFVIFQRLHTRQDYPGTGIGLAICRKIVEKHGGKIWMESEPGKGTTFYFTIPTKQRKRLYASY